MAEPNSNPTARDDEKQEEGAEEVLFNATRHDHELLLFEGLPPYRCSGCKEYGVNRGYKCKISSSSKCKNFTLHEVCAALPDAIQHPSRSDVIIKFRSKTLVRHHCSACCEVMKGFVFETELPNTMLHPLCMALPDVLDYDGHANHKLKIVTGDLKGKAYTCSFCDSYIACGGWRYRCEDVTCKVYVHPTCAKYDIFGLTDFGIHQVASVGHSTSGGKTEISAGLVQPIITGVSERDGGRWRYRWEDMARKVYVDPSCAKNDIFGLSKHGIHRVASVGHSTSGGMMKQNPGLQFDVFINHKGADVKNSLATLIYHQLKTKDPNLRVFLDIKEIPCGVDFSYAIETAIQSSSVHIAIFSERYAESKWCLHELDLIIKSRRKLIPVFCDVDPASLRRIEKGCYQKAFEKHRGREPLEKTKRWEHALARASYLQGLLFKMKESDHWEFVEKIVSNVLEEFPTSATELEDFRSLSGTHD